MIALSGKCAAWLVRGRAICRAKSLEEMMEHCQFFSPRGTTCAHLDRGSYRLCRSSLVRFWLEEEKQECPSR